MTTAELNEAARDLIEDLVQLRMNRGLNQTQLAARMGTHRCNISLIENHHRMPGLAVLLLRYADALGVDLTFVMRRRGQ